MWFDRIAWAPTAGDRPAGGLERLRAETVVPASLEETFAFFADAANLERLTPPWLRFRIVTRMPLEMREGAVIDYRIVLRGIPIPWRSRVDVWEPGKRFVDRQVTGPYRWWRHEHQFEPAPSGTRVIDSVEFVPRLRWLTAGLVRRDVQRIFAYRQDRLPQFFARPLRPGALPSRRDILPSDR
jgi:ligand-binding SRPBCC domain-containing protein